MAHHSWSTLQVNNIGKLPKEVKWEKPNLKKILVNCYRHKKAKQLKRPRGENRDIWPAGVQYNKTNILFYKSKNIKKHTNNSELAMFFNLTFFTIFAVFVQLFAILWFYQDSRVYKGLIFYFKCFWSGNPTFYPFKVLDTHQFMLDVFRGGLVGWGENVILTFCMATWIWMLHLNKVFSISIP